MDSLTRDGAGVRVMNENGVVGGIEDLPVTPLPLLKGFLRPPALGDVTCDTDKANGAAIG